MANNKEEEIWKDIPGYENLYKVNQWGDIYSVGRKKVLSPTVGNEGYKQYVLHANGERHLMSAHRAVALAFIPNPENYPIVNHKDENKLNCYVDNLEWCTYAYNNTYNGINKKAGAKRRKPLYCYNIDGTLYKKYESQTEACEEFGVQARTIYSIAQWKSVGEGQRRILLNGNKTFSNIPRSKEEVLNHIYSGDFASQDPRYKDSKDAVKKCPGCGRRIPKEQDLCEECLARKNSTKLFFTKDDLKRELFCRSIKKIAKKYKATDAAIIKWCKKYNLEYKVDVLTNTSDYGILNEEWNDILEENMKKKAEAEERRKIHAEESKPKAVIMLDKETGEELARFESIEAAARSIGKLSPHIASVCKGKRKSAFGYLWRFA